MGQKLLGLIKTRKGRKGAPCQGALARRFRRVRSQEEGIAASPSNGVESSKSSFIEASPKALHVNQELETKNAPATLLILPTELIFAVAHYLPPSGYMSLSYSCRTIRNKMGASIAHVLGDKVPMGRHSGTTLSIESRNIRYLERLDLQCMLERDRKMSSSKVSSLFHSPWSIPVLSRFRREWRYSRNAGQLWICPHRQFTYYEATASRGVSDKHKCKSSPLFWNRRFGDSFISKFPIMRVPRDHVPSYEEVREALRPLDAPVCPHLRLNNVCEGTLYHQSCPKKRLDPGGIDGTHCGYGLRSSLEEPWWKACNFCGAMIFLNFVKDHQEPKTLIALVVRSFQGTSGLNGRAWVAQVAQPADFEEYRRAWQATHAECMRKLRSFSHV